MLSKIALLLTLASFSATLRAADLASEYEQVKTIAARDPKVRAAYEAADRKLAERIVEIDPTLKGYTPGKAAPKKTATASAPAAAPAAKHSRTPGQSGGAYQRSHVVEQGETLGSIAAKYHVSTADLRKVNEIRDEKKLPVGQVLAIPNSSSAPAKLSAPKAAAPKSATAKKTTTSAKPAEKSWWDSVKGNF